MPHSSWNPGTSTVRLAAGVGLWDAAAGRYLTPGDSADAQHPGRRRGTRRIATAFFNAAFRFHEPWQHTYPPDSVFTDPAWWRDREQGDALAPRRPDPVPRQGRLRQARPRRSRTTCAGARRASRRSGPMDRILASHFETQQGADYGASLLDSATDCQGELRGRLQPYAIYVPAKPMPPAGYGLTLLLHSLGANYNQFSDSRNQSQLGDRGTGSIVITPEGRGPDGWYYGHAGADTFEVWADVAAPLPPRPRLDRRSRVLDGRLRHLQVRHPVPGPVRPGQPGRRAPGAGVWVPPSPPQPGGAASNTNRMLASVRNIPFLIWDGAEDELVPVAGATPRRRPSTISATATSTTCSRPPTTSRSRWTTSTRPRRDSSVPTRWIAIRRTSPTSSTRRWTSRASGRSPTTPTGCPACGSATARRTPRSATSTRDRGVRSRRSRRRSDPDLPLEAASGGQPAAAQLQRAKEDLGSTAERPKRNVLHIARPECGPRRGAPGEGPPELPGAARRGHGRAPGRHARRVRLHPALRLLGPGLDPAARRPPARERDDLAPRGRIGSML